MKINRNIPLMYAIAFLQGLIFYGSISTIYRESHGISISEIFIIESISFIIIILLEVPWGIFADKFGYKKTIVLSNFIFFVSKLFFWKANSFSLFLLERILLSISLAGLSGCDNALIYLSLNDDDNSEKIFGKYDFYSNMGLIISSLLSGFIVNIRMELTGFLTCITYGLATFISLFLKDLENVKIDKLNLKDNLKLAFKKKNFIFLLVAFSLITEVVQSITVFLNQKQYMKTGINLEFFGLLLTLVSIIKLLSAKSYKISYKLGQNRSILLFSIIIGISSISLIFSNFSILSVLLICIIAGSGALIMPMITDLKNKSIVDGNRATILSIYSMIGSIISALINPIIGSSANISLELGFASCSIITLIGSFIVWLCFKQ